MENKKFIKFGVIFLIGILAIGFASSFAVSTKYWKGNPIKATPGEKVDFFVILQNIAGDGGDIKLEGIFSEGEDIAKFTDESNIYFVPFGSKVRVNLSLIVPVDSNIGKLSKIIVSFKILEGTNSAQFGIGSSIEREIPLEVIDFPKKEPFFTFPENFQYYVFGVIILILLGIILFLYRKRKTQKRK